MMKSSPEIVRFSAPLRNAVSSAPAWSNDLEHRIQERERAAAELGRAEAQKLFGEQLISQRTELMMLQKGILGAIKDAAPQVMKACEGHLIELAIEIARKVVEDAPITAVTVENAISTAMREVEESAKYTVLVNPDDLQLLEKAASALLRSDESQRVTVIPSQDVTRGGCIVETPFGRVDARRETKFELLKDTLLN